MPHEVEMRLRPRAPLLLTNASKNQYFLRVIVLRPFSGSGEGVRKGFNRISGAIIKVEVVLIISKTIAYSGVLVGLIIRTEF